MIIYKAMFILIILVPVIIILIFIAYGLFFREDIQESIDRAVGFIQSNNLDLALKILKELGIKHKDVPQIHWHLADIYHKKAIYELSEQELQKILALKKFTDNLKESDVRKKLAKVLWDDRKLDEAFKELILVSQIEPDNISLNLELGQICIEKENYKDAIKYIEKYINFNPTNGNAFLLLGEAYFYLQMLAPAQFNLTKALQIDPNLNKTHFYLGMIFSNQQEYDKALKEFEYPQQDKYSKFYSAYEKAKIFQQKNIYENAINEYKKAMEIGVIQKNQEYDIKYAIAECLVKSDKIGEAVKYWEDIYKNNPQYKDIKDKITRYYEFKEADIFNKFLKAPESEFISISEAIVEAMNYSVVEYNLRKDGILDIVAFEKNKKTTENYLIEIIRTESEIGELVLREMNAKMQDLQVYRGICIATSNFTSAAIAYTKNRGIELLDKSEFNKILNKIKIPV